MSRNNIKELTVVLQEPGATRLYLVKSSSHDGTKYMVDGETGACDCPSSCRFGNWCKHAAAVFRHFGSALPDFAATDEQKLSLLKLAKGELSQEDIAWFLTPHIPAIQESVADRVEESTSADASQQVTDSGSTEGIQVVTEGSICRKIAELGRYV